MTAAATGEVMWTPDPVMQRYASSGTKRRDRLEKPAEYAAAGVRHYWRIEPDPVHVFAYDLVDGAYRLVADSTVELVLAEPFTITLPIRDIAP